MLGAAGEGHLGGPVGAKPRKIATDIGLTVDRLNQTPFTAAHPK